MKFTDPSPNTLSGTDWRMLGEFELRIGADTNGEVSAWIAEILSPLNLHADFLKKILKSAQEAVARVVRTDSAALEFEHLHLLIFAPADRTAEGDTWGFFRIEKAGTSTTKENPSDHSIEFYLYLEG